MDQSVSWFKMVDRLLALKKPISEYFRQHPQNTRKLTSHEWTVTNEVCTNATLLPPPPEGIPTESTQVAELTLKAQDVREVQLEVTEDKGVGKAPLKVERLCALLDPRRKALGADQLVNGSAALRTRVEEDLKGVIAKFADA